MKRVSFALLIALLHLLFSFVIVVGLCVHSGGQMAGETLFAKIILAPVYYPFRHAPNALWLVPANSLLWGVMAERLVFGRKTVLRRRAK